MMLFYVNEKGALLHGDAVKLEPTLKKLTDMELLFIILIYDYNSPYKQIGELQKKLTACRRCFDNDDHAKYVKKLEKAIEAYNGLQYDIRRETIRNYGVKISHLNLQLMATDSTTDIKRLHEATDYLIKTSMRLEKELVMEEMSLQNETMSGASFLEKWQDNRRRYKNDKQVIDIARG